MRKSLLFGKNCLSVFFAIIGNFSGNDLEVVKKGRRKEYKSGFIVRQEKKKKENSSKLWSRLRKKTDAPVRVWGPIDFQRGRNFCTNIKESGFSTQVAGEGLSESIRPARIFFPRVDPSPTTNSQILQSEEFSFHRFLETTRFRNNVNTCGS